MSLDEWIGRHEGERFSHFYFNTSWVYKVVGTMHQHRLRLKVCNHFSFSGAVLRNHLFRHYLSDKQDNDPEVWCWDKQTPQTSSDDYQWGLRSFRTPQYSSQPSNNDHKDDNPNQGGQFFELWNMVLNNSYRWTNLVLDFSGIHGGLPVPNLTSKRVSKGFRIMDDPELMLDFSDVLAFTRRMVMWRYCNYIHMSPILS